MSDTGRIPGDIDVTLRNVQRRVQGGTGRVRPLSEYSRRVFEDKNPASQFLRQRVPGAPESFAALLANLNTAYAAQGGAYWVDMAGGQAVAMREATHRVAEIGRLAMRCVDLFPYSEIPVSREDQDRVTQQVGANVWGREYEPPFTQADAQTIQLDRPAQLITCFEALQYFPDPLEAICNWYNQLEPNGLLIVNVSLPWSFFISQVGGNPDVLVSMVDDLQAAGIACATNQERDSVAAGAFRTLVMQRREGTALERRALVAEQVFRGGFSYVTYDQGQLVEAVGATS